MAKFNIYHRKDGRWEGRSLKGKRSDGSRKYQYFFGRTREEVENQMLEMLSSKEITECCSKTLSEIFKEWYKSIVHKIKESTAANYLMKMRKHILPKFGEISVDTIISDDVYEFIEQKQADGLSNRYILDIVVLLKTIFKYAVRTYHISNPMDNVILLHKKPTDVKMLDENEEKVLEQYIAENPNKTSMGIALSMSTGIRIGELCALKWEDVDLKKRILTVSKTIQRVQITDGDTKTKLIITEPKSESSNRKIPIPDCVMGLLRKFKGKSSEYILTGKEKPIEPRTMQYRFSKILKNVNLPSIHFHALRHMFASDCVKAGVDMKYLSEILGHSKVEITMNRYVHSSFDKKTEYINLLNYSF